MLFDAVTFIEAANTYIKILLSHFAVGGLSCMQSDTEAFYSLIENLSEHTTNLEKSLGEGGGQKVRTVFMNLSGIEKKDFKPDTKKISEFKEFLRNEPNRVIKNSFSFIMLLQSHKVKFEQKKGAV